MYKLNGERILATLGATTILVVGISAVGYATTGGGVLLGKTNKADRAAAADTLGGKTLGNVLTSAAPKTTTYVDTANHTTDAVIYGPVAVPAGTYLVTFDADVTLNTHGTTSVPNPMVCQLQSDTPTVRALAEGAWNITGTFWHAAPSFSRVITLDADSTVRWYCATDKHDGWTIASDGFGPTLSFTALGAQTVTAP